MTTETGWNRREFLGAGALLALVIGVPIGINMLTADPDDAPSERQREIMRLVSDIVIPRTGTPGAGEVGTGDFVILALAHGLDGTRNAAASTVVTTALPQYRRQDGTLRYVAWLENALDRAANGDWVGKTAARRAAVLRRLDAAAFEEGPYESPWRKIKGLILTGYYTSQTGAARELQFVLDPGRYDPNVPLGPNARAFSSDWTAVDFG